MDIQRYEKRIRARERRRAAVHEAGHLTIARTFGVPCTARIEPTAATAFGGDRTWVGACSIAFGAARRGEQRQIAIAGVVAEHCWFGEPDEWWSVLDNPDVTSSTDWEWCGCAPGEPDNALIKTAHKVSRLFTPRTGKLWVSLVKTARLLILEARARPYQTNRL